MKLALTLPLGIMITGLIISWLWLRTESIWLVAIAHGALNSWGQYALKYMKDFTSMKTDAVAGGAGSLALLVVAIVLLWRNAVVGDAASHEALHDQMAGK